MACLANRISGRQQELAGNREEVLPMALYELLESISFTEWRMSIMASKAKHQWLDFVDHTRIELGIGDRVLVKGGVYISKYRISIPKEMATL